MDDEPAITAKLPEPGQALGDGEPATFQRGVGFCYIGHLWTRPDQRHVSHENVEQLRKLVQTCFSEEPPCGGNALVFRTFRRTLIFWNVCVHTAEFEHKKRLAGLACPLLAKENG